MAKLHELLAVEGNLKTQAEKVRTDLRETFEKKRHLFEEKVLTFTPNAEGAKAVTESRSDIQTTVRKELEWISPILSRAINAGLQIAVANTTARADILLDDGRTLATGVPVTALLELEKRAVEFRELLSAVPTLDPAKAFQADPDRGKGIYRAREVEKTRTKKIQKPVVLYEATKEHPAQVQLVSEDIPIGALREQEWSGMITPAEKAEMLDRAEQVVRAIKQARSRANDTEIVPAPDSAKEIFAFILA